MSADDAAAPTGPTNNETSSRSSDISIEEINPEEARNNIVDPEVTVSPSSVVLDEDKEDKSGEPAADKEASPEASTVEKEASQNNPEPIKPQPSARFEAESDPEEDDDDDEDDEDESLMERLVGLTEMFPEGMTSGIQMVAKMSLSGAKAAYALSRAITWVVFSSAAVLFLPVMIESERLGIEEADKLQQRQILLGPGSAVSGGAGQRNAPLPATS